MEKDLLDHAAGLAHFLDAQATLTKKATTCTDCGSTLRYINTYFCLYRTDRQWTIALPFCIVCQAELVPELLAEDRLII
jgi:hypothetical protein